MDETSGQADHASTHDAIEDPRNRDLRIWVNGRLVHRDAAMVSVYDSGFLLGDGVWEGLRLHNGVWAFLEPHLERLYEGARVIDLDIGRPPTALADALYEVAEANGMMSDAHARLMVTRGIKAKPFQDPRLSRSGPTIVIIAEHSVAAPPARGIRLHTVPVVRGMPMSQDPKLNSHSKLNCILAGIHAQKAGADEALMLDPHGFVNTTNACNFFIVRRGELWTSTGDYCMNGITRGHAIELARADGIMVRERNFSLVETYSAEEAFITGSFGGLTRVSEIDGRRIGGGIWTGARQGSGEGAGERAGEADGPVLARLKALYADLVARETVSHRGAGRAAPRDPRL